MMRFPCWLLAGALLAGGAAPIASHAAPAAQAKQKAPQYDAKKLAALEAKLKKSPKDAKLKAQVAEASYQVGHAMMLNPELPPRVKYPGALRHFRRTLALNPKHKQAAAEKKQIEDIYRQMGRPIPA